MAIGDFDNDGSDEERVPLGSGSEMSALESSERDDSEDEDEPWIHCLCPSTADEGEMVRCDDCQRWYHTECLEEEFTHDNKGYLIPPRYWKCSRCDDGTENPFQPRSSRQRPEEVEAFADADDDDDDTPTATPAATPGPSGIGRGHNRGRGSGRGRGRGRGRGERGKGRGKGSGRGRGRGNSGPQEGAAAEGPEQISALMKEATEMNWTQTKPDSADYTQQFPFRGQHENGVPSGAACTVQTAIEAFTCFFTVAAVSLVITQTNLHMARNPVKLKGTGGTRERISVTTAEFWVFLAVLILVEIHGKQHISDNWSTRKLLETPIFSKTMARDRFLEIHSMLHFADNEAPQNTNASDRFWKIRDFFSLVTGLFGQLWSLGRYVSVDESLLLWKGNHSLRRYIPSKADKWGFKFFILACAATGFVFRIMVDEGAENKYPLSAALTATGVLNDMQVPGKIVLSLMEPLFNMGHVLVTDNWYSDIVLFLFLLKQGIHCMGTVRKGRRLLPTAITKKSWKANEKGEMLTLFSSNFFAFTWLDKKDVRFLSSFGSPEMNPVTKKPAVIDLYNHGMPGVDLADQIRHGRQIARNRLKRWYRKIFEWLLDLMLVNAYICLRAFRPKLTHHDFRLELVDQILRKYQGTYDEEREGRKRRRETHAESGNATRMTGRHVVIDKRGQRACASALCPGTPSGNIAKPNLFCVECDANLCIPDCWTAYHTNENAEKRSRKRKVDEEDE